MAVAKLYAPNPDDGTTTFDKVRFYRATSSAGAGSTLLTTVSIDTTGKNPTDPGFTSYIYTSALSTYYYAASWYNSTSGVETDKSDWLLQGQDRWDTMFMEEMQDTSAAVWSATDRDYFKKKVLEALYPDLYRLVIDTSLTIEATSGSEQYVYTVPYGIFDISEVGIGDVNNITSTFKIMHPDKWKFERDQLHFSDLGGLDDGETIRLVASKKYLAIGEVPERFDPMVMEHLRMSAYVMMADDFPRFLQWSRMQKGTGVTFESLRIHAREFERRFNTERARLHEVMLATLT